MASACGLEPVAVRAQAVCTRCGGGEAVRQAGGLCVDSAAGRLGIREPIPNSALARGCGAVDRVGYCGRKARVPGKKGFESVRGQFFGVISSSASDLRAFGQFFGQFFGVSASASVLRDVLRVVLWARMKVKLQGIIEVAELHIEKQREVKAPRGRPAAATASSLYDDEMVFPIRCEPIVSSVIVPAGGLLLSQMVTVMRVWIVATNVRVAQTVTVIVTTVQ
eukprot:COSAG05_NODE_1480_length_4767_cov_2.424379_5_plen_222_part_00